MNYTRPRYEHWASKLVTAVFLLFVGGLVNQFLNIPAQQVQMRADFKAMEIRLVALEQQHMVMMKQLDDLKKHHESGK